MSHRDRIAEIKLKPCPRCGYADGDCSDDEPIPPGPYRIAPPEPERPRLTDREREVACWLALDLSHKEIGRRLGTTARNIQGLRAKLMNKLDVEGVAALTRLAVRLRWIVPVDGDPTSDYEVKNR